MREKNVNFSRRLVEELWSVWAIAAGSVALIMIIALFVPKPWMPLPVFFISYLLYGYRNRLESKDDFSDIAPVRVAYYTLFWTATIMLVINILNSKMLLDNYINWSNSNKDIPFVTCLVIFPTMFLCCLWVLTHPYKLHVNDTVIDITPRKKDVGVIATLFYREERYQLLRMCFMSVAISGVEWWYYFVYYYNVNMNTPDKFFFNYMPAALYVFSLFFMWSRYQNLAAIIGPVKVAIEKSGMMLRFLVLSEDKLLLAMNEFDRWDTPVISRIDKIDESNEKKIEKTFSNITETTDFKLKRLYSSHDGAADVDTLHYAAFVTSETSLKEWDKTDWYTLDQIDRMLKSARLSNELAEEIYRIFTITMAWKTYDRDGRRLYPIKHYRPTFRLKDLKDWSVDYDDVSWFDVASNNQDRPFFRTRKLIRKITGFHS